MGPGRRRGAGGNRAAVAAVRRPGERYREESDSVAVACPLCAGGKAGEAAGGAAAGGGGLAGAARWPRGSAGSRDGRGRRTKSWERAGVGFVA